MNCGIKRIIQFKEAQIFHKVSIYNANGVDVTGGCMFSWSVDMVCWTNWVNYETYLMVGKNIESDFYLRILITDSLGRVLVDNQPTNCYSICIDGDGKFLQDLCSDVVFQPYSNLDCALQLQQQLSDSVVCMFGIPAYYFKVDPKNETKDYTFKEYTLYGVTDVKQIKLVIQDNTMPSSNPVLNEFDFDWQTDWEVEISKTQFAKAFGDYCIPMHRDFIYIPMMKRLWSVNAAYEEKNGNLMWRATTWKLALVKYNEKTNISEDSIEGVLDNLGICMYEDVWGRLEENEQERESGVSQVDVPRFTATNLYNVFMEDAIRKQYTKEDINILDKTFCHRANVVARNIYKFKNENACVTYQKPICGDEGVLSFIIETPGKLEGEMSKDILNFGEISIYMSYNQTTGDISLIFNDLQCVLEPFQAYMVILRWDRRTYVTEMNIYKYTHPSNIPLFKLRPEMYYFDFENPVCTLTHQYNDDLCMYEKLPCQIHAYPFQVSNIKYYNRYLSLEESLKEMIKYVTNHESCVINDIVRPLDDGHGYSVR